MESRGRIDGKLDGYRFHPWNLKRQVEPSSDFSRHEFRSRAIFGRQGPKPHRDTVVVTQWEERLEAYFWLVRYQWAALHHSPYLLYIFTSANQLAGKLWFLFSLFLSPSLFLFTVDVFECEPRSWLKFRVIFKTACLQWKHSISRHRYIYIYTSVSFRISLSKSFPFDRLSNTSFETSTYIHTSLCISLNFKNYIRNIKREVYKKDI